MIKLYFGLKGIDTYIYEILKMQIFKSRKSLIKACPKCSSHKYIKYGYFKGIQRYKCKECGKTFSLVTNTLCSYSKKKLEIWIRFIELMLEKKTLIQCAKELKINVNTAFYWRHKIMSTLTLIDVAKLLKGIIHITNMQIKENFKGSRHIDTDERKNIFLTTVKAEVDSIISSPISKVNWSWNEFNNKIYNKIEKNSIIIPYRDRYIQVLARNHNKKDINNVEKDKFISDFYSIYKDWFKGFYGIATKYVNKYLSWFILYYRDKVFKNIDILKQSLKYDSFVRIKDIRI